MKRWLWPGRPIQAARASFDLGEPAANCGDDDTAPMDQNTFWAHVATCSSECPVCWKDRPWLDSCLDRPLQAATTPGLGVPK